MRSLRSSIERPLFAGTDFYEKSAGKSEQAAQHHLLSATIPSHPPTAKQSTTKTKIGVRTVHPQTSPLSTKNEYLGYKRPITTVNNMMEEADDEPAGRQTFQQQQAEFSRVMQYWLDKSTVHIVPRWSAFGFLLFVFFLRIYFVQGYFIVAYGLGIFLLNNFIAFLSPLEDPTDQPGLPTTANEGKEFRPFARRLPEFKFWLTCARGTATCIVMTFFSVFDIPVFWPILLMYFFVLFFMTMKRQIMHMYKHKYIPISFGKSKPKHAGVENGMFGGGMHKGK